VSATWITVDGNEACAAVAYQLSDVVAIYPITPSSGMAEAADAWSAARRPNLWGAVPTVVEMQSEGGAAGAVHGALQGGGLATTFTASQGLLLMIPNMFKIAGELTPAVFHVTARAIATHALSIFGDHSDVMSVRSTGFALLSSSSVQEAQDLALIAHAATLESRVPFLHFFDGFRTSHELQKIAALEPGVVRAMVDDTLVQAQRARALTPDHPVVRGTAQNPDVFFQNREAVNRHYLAAPSVVQDAMDRFAALTGRAHRLFEYHGARDAERVIVIMGSGAETVRATVAALGTAAKVGVVTVKLYRPFSVADFVAVLPSTVRAIGVLDRTKEPGAIGEPLYQDVVTALAETAVESGAALQGCDRRLKPCAHSDNPPARDRRALRPRIERILTRDGQGGLRRTRQAGAETALHRRHRRRRDGAVAEGERELPGRTGGSVRAVFYGLGADGTVGANKNSIKIIGEETDNWAQGYFVFDSKKSGAMTISHLRFGPRPIAAPYLVAEASFVGCHQYAFLERYDVLECAAPGGVFLLNSPHGSDDVWDELPFEIQREIVRKRLRFYVIDAYAGRESGGAGQSHQHDHADVLLRHLGRPAARPGNRAHQERDREELQEARCGSRAEEFRGGRSDARAPPRGVRACVADRLPSASLDGARRGARLRQARHRGDAGESRRSAARERVPDRRHVADRHRQVGEAQHRNRDPSVGCGAVHSVQQVRARVSARRHPRQGLRRRRAGCRAPDVQARPVQSTDLPGEYTVQVAPEDCTGCSLCVMMCPAKDKADPAHRAIDMAPQPPLRQAERDNYEFFLDLPEVDRTHIKPDVKSTQFLEPLFEYSGACAGCGETPYVKLLTQLFGDRVVVANAYRMFVDLRGQPPTTPYNDQSRGARTGVGQFVVRGQRGVRVRPAAIDRSARGAGTGAAHRACGVTSG
jgi:pyruvate-ferredoxin/flavodoxin oxidoreductase